MNLLRAVKDKVVEVANTPVSELALWRGFHFPKVKCIVNGKDLFKKRHGKRSKVVREYQARHLRARQELERHLKDRLELERRLRAYSPIRGRSLVRITPRVPMLRR